jgi:hypothetical protein
VRRVMRLGAQRPASHRWAGERVLSTAIVGQLRVRIGCAARSVAETNPDTRRHDSTRFRCHFLLCVFAKIRGGQLRDLHTESRGAALLAKRSGGSVRPERRAPPKTIGRTRGCRAARGAAAATALATRRRRITSSRRPSWRPRQRPPVGSGVMSIGSYGAVNACEEQAGRATFRGNVSTFRASDSPREREGRLSGRALAHGREGAPVS